MRHLGIDYGLKRVGLALSDPQGILAFAHTTIGWERRDELFAQLLQVIEQERVEAIVIGLPLGLDGQDTETTRMVRNFAARLGRRTDLPIHLIDERYTSYEAEQAMKEAGVSWKKRKKNLDSQAAATILESFLRDR